MAKQEDSGHSFLAYFKRATSPLAVCGSYPTGRCMGMN